jgi:hypothetical protein
MAAPPAMKNAGGFQTTAGPGIPGTFRLLKIRMDKYAAGIATQSFAKGFQYGLFCTPDKIGYKRLSYRIVIT